MKELWSVGIEAGTTSAAEFDSATINERLDDFLEYLVDYSASATGCPDEPDGFVRYGARMAVETDSPVDAAVTGLTAFRDAVKKAELPEFPVTKVDVTSWEAFERELDQPTYPTVIGVAEIARMLSVTRQRASEVARSAQFPKPYAELASGPVWFDSNVKRFVQVWDRKPGRPRKVTPSQPRIAPETARKSPKNAGVRT